MGSRRRYRGMTATQEEQQMVECQVMNIYHEVSTLPPAAQSQWFEVHRDEHIEFLTKSLTQLGPSLSVLDANRPWLCYWILHSIALLREVVDDDIKSNAVDFLNRCQHQNGGFGGGPGQLPHLATTYAAVNSLITLGGERSLSSINRNNLHAFLLRMKEKNGGFRMHDGGEIDVRACYTAISVASILNILDDDLVQNVGSYILSCQTYEGGIGGEPGSEAHGGYTYCGLATMILINEVNLLDLASLTDWVVCRQGMEGGFQGRTNKLVDGCYSFWQGQVAVLVQRLVSIFQKENGISDIEEEDHCAHSCQSSTELGGGEQCLDGEIVDDPCWSEEAEGQQSPPKRVIHSFGIGSDCTRGNAEADPFFHSIALQQYILLCSQVPGGFRDKPGKPRDHYHTCYCLSGLSVCQYSKSDDVEAPPFPAAVLGSYSNNLLQPTHPLFNVVFERYREAQEFFSMPS